MESTNTTANADQVFGTAATETKVALTELCAVELAYVGGGMAILCWE